VWQVQPAAPGAAVARDEIECRECSHQPFPATMFRAMSL
jgi:hypothetical protein